jgi:hypothetical protein
VITPGASLRFCPQQSVNRPQLPHTLSGGILTKGPWIERARAGASHRVPGFCEVVHGCPRSQKKGDKIMQFRKRLVALTVSAIVLVGSAVAAPLVFSGGVAGASGRTHKWIQTSDNSTYPESLVKIKLKCTSTSVSLTITKVNLVNSAGQSFVQNGDLSIDVTVDPSDVPPMQFTQLTQNTSTDLWQASRTDGILPGPCISGATVTFGNEIPGGSGSPSLGNSFHFTGTLS